MSWLILNISRVCRLGSVCIVQIDIDGQERLIDGGAAEDRSFLGLYDPADAGEVASVSGRPGQV